VIASRDGHALLPSDKAGSNPSGGGGADLKILASDKTPVADAYQSMLREGVKRLHEGMK
jgi:hypothetical protein